MADCPICTTPLRDDFVKYPSEWQFECFRCGLLCLHGPALTFGSILHRLFSNLPDQQILHRRSKVSHTLKRQERPSALNVVDVQKIAEWRLDDPLPSVLEQLDELVLWASDNQVRPDTEATIKIPALCAYLGTLIDADGEESAIEWLAIQPETERLITVRILSDTAMLQLTVRGWDYARQLKQNVQKSRIAFMAMAFGSPEMNAVVENCFRPAVSRAGFELRLLTDKQPAGTIDDQLRVAIRTSRFVIADLSHKNNGAYWEAGFAEGLSRPVIYTCRLDVWEQEKTHFDTNHLATIIWNQDDLASASRRLTDMIRATLPSEAKMED